MNYKNAWKCHRCPQSNGEDGCPAWTEMTYSNDVTGEVKVEKECLFAAMPKLLLHICQLADIASHEASNAPQKVVESLAVLANQRKEQLSNFDKDKDNGNNG